MGQPSIPIFTLCDGASVREGLLHILGAGITAIQRNGQYPSTLGASLAALINFANVSAAPSSATVTITNSTGDPIGVEDLSLDFERDSVESLHDDVLYTIPVVIDVSTMTLPEAGRYRFRLSVDGMDTSSSIYFDAY